MNSKFFEKLATELGSDEPAKRTLPQLIKETAEKLAQAFIDRVNEELFEESPPAAPPVIGKAPEGELNWTFSVDGQRILLSPFWHAVPKTHEEVDRLLFALDQAHAWLEGNTGRCLNCTWPVPLGTAKCPECNAR